MKSRQNYIILILFCLLSFCACTNRSNQQAQFLNDKAYYYHYRSLDSVKVYADSVLALDDISDVAKAEALNNLVFYNIGRMRYTVADSLILEIYDATDNQTELLIAAIQKMRICQRRSDNKTFFEFRQRAQQHLRRINEDTPTPNPRLIYAESEYHLVASVYDYYLGQPEAAAAELRVMDSIPYLKQDTVQYVAYLYNIGSGGILTHGSKEDIHHQELEHLMQCFVISDDLGYTYWKANAIQALSEHLLDCDINELPDVSLAQRYLNISDVPDSLVAGNLAMTSLALFQQYGDIYQQAATWRTLAYCYSNLHDYPGAIYSLEQALKVDTAISSVPSLEASIHEQFSLAYSALGLKQQSDYHRNLYLDLYEDTRQDRELEARIEELNSRVTYLNTLLYIIIATASLLLAWLFYLILKRYRLLRQGRHTSRVTMLLEERRQKLAEVDEKLEELDEACQMKTLELYRQQDTYAEQRAKMHLLNSLTPLLDRMLHETRSLCNNAEPEKVREERCNYLTELIARINQQNNFLTQWIQMKRGELSLRIESFELSKLFDVIAANGATIRRQGITLDIQPTSLCVKADRTLTLFMLNTLCDNARKFTPTGGRISLYACECEQDMVEVSVRDTGSGMTAEQLEHLFDVKPIVDEQLSAADATMASSSHGFGLLNCKGIIEKYKKTNSLFSQCTLDVESKIGEGTRFFFRLPKGIKRLAIVIVILLQASARAFASNAVANTVMPTDSTVAFADSVYQCNVSGRYNEAIAFAEQYFRQLSRLHPHHDIPSLRGTEDVETMPIDVLWLRDSVDVDYQVLLSVRNEIAVAALALNDWPLYHYNNNAYTLLYRELSIDPSLAEYYAQMTATEFNSHIAVIVIILLFLSLVPIYYFAYYRNVILDVRTEMLQTQEAVTKRQQQCQEKKEQLSRLTYEYDRLHVLNNVISNSFSAIKHETMYYPSRLQQLLLDINDNAAELDEVARYYRAVYGMLTAQAQYNCHYQLPSDVLRQMMLRLIAQLSGQRTNELTPELQPPYSVYRFTIKNVTGSAASDTLDVRFRVLVLVVRDLGEIYALRRCGVNVDEGMVTVTAPSA